MSWTSEFEPSPPRPNLEPDGFTGDGFEVVGPDDRADQDQLEQAADAEPSSEIPDDGPLDPSIFDGLFDDLSDDGPPDTGHSNDHDENGHKSGTADEHEYEVEVEPLPASRDDAPEQPADPEPGLVIEQPDSPVDAQPQPVDSTSGNVANGVTLDPDITPFEATALQSHDPNGQHPHDPNGQHPHDPGGLYTDDQAAVSSADAIFVETRQPAQVTPTTGAGLFEPVVDPAQPGSNHLRQAANGFRGSGPLHNGAAAGIGHLATDGGTQLIQPRTPAVVYRAPKPAPRWPAFAIATVVGAVLGVGGALLLFQLVRSSDSGTEGETASPATTAAPAAPTQRTALQPTDGGVGISDTPVSTTRTSLTSLAATGRFELNTINFIPGTVELTERSEALLDEVAEVMIVRPDQPVSVSVRTFSEASPSANRELSGRQGDAIVDHLVGLGAPVAQLQVRGLGAAMLDLAQPVQNFVVVNTDLGTSDIAAAIENISPFAIGIDPITNQLRPESIEPLNMLGGALAAIDGTAVSLAAYSYGEPDSTRNRELGTVAAEAAAAYLVANHGIDRERVSILAPGQALYVIGADTGSHVSLQWGEAAAAANRLAELTSADVFFAPGSARLTDETIRVLDGLIGLVSETNLTVVLQVHAASESTEIANLNLSNIQAATIADYLLGNGLTEPQVRSYGGGNLRQFDGDEQANRLVATALP